MRRHEESALPRNAFAAHIRTHFCVKHCLHPLAGLDTCGKIISAHTIQREGAIRSIIDQSNHVLTFYPLEFGNADTPRIHRRGWRDASTFYGFCDQHDGPTFAPFESVPFVATFEQCFLVAYRAHCHELYQKHASVDAHPSIRNIVDRGASQESQRKLQRILAIRLAGAAKGLANAEARKQVMDADLLAKDYSRWQSVIFGFSGETSIAGTGAVTPNVDICENNLQVLHDPFSQLEYLYFGILPTTNGGAFVFTWLRTDDAPHRFVDSLLALPMQALPHILAQFMFAYCENTYFSAAWWSMLQPCMSQHLSQLAANANPYYSTIHYRTEDVVPWRVTSVLEQ